MWFLEYFPRAERRGSIQSKHCGTNEQALGATHRAILVQFLVESATLTGIGGALGIVVGLTLGRLVTMLMNIDAGVPILLTLVAVTVSVGIGVVFGILPARRAARLDPIEALRYE